MVMSKRERYIGIMCGLVLGLLVMDRIFFTPLNDRLKELGDEQGGLIAQAQLELTGAKRTLETGDRAKKAWNAGCGYEVSCHTSCRSRALECPFGERKRGLPVRWSRIGPRDRGPFACPAGPRPGARDNGRAW